MPRQLYGRRSLPYLPAPPPSGAAPAPQAARPRSILTASGALVAAAVFAASPGRASLQRVPRAAPPAVVAARPQPIRIVRGDTRPYDGRFLQLPKRPRATSAAPPRRGKAVVALGWTRPYDGRFLQTGRPAPRPSGLPPHGGRILQAFGQTRPYDGRILQFPRPAKPRTQSVRLPGIRVARAADMAPTLGRASVSRRIFAPPAAPAAGPTRKRILLAFGSARPYDGRVLRLPRRAPIPTAPAAPKPFHRFVLRAVGESRPYTGRAVLLRVPQRTPLVRLPRRILVASGQWRPYAGRVVLPKKPLRPSARRPLRALVAMGSPARGERGRVFLGRRVRAGVVVGGVVPWHLFYRVR